MSIIKKFQKNCDCYRKYVICMVLNKKKYFTLWGTDSEDKEKDKFLLDKLGNIALFKNVNDLFYSVNSNDLVFFDKSKTVKWMNKSKNILNKKLIDYISNENVFNLEQFPKIVTVKKSSLAKLSNLKYNLFIDIINIIADYGFQIGNKSLLKLIKNKNISLFWKYSYDRVLWGVKEEDKLLINRLLLRKLKITDLRKKLFKLKSLFLKNIHIKD